MYRYIQKNEDQECHGDARYLASSMGCGCCQSEYDLTIEKCKNYIACLEEKLNEARAALEDMEQNGEKLPESN